MMKKTVCYTSFFLFVLFHVAAYGQNIPDSARIYRIDTKDGNTFTGVIVSEDSLLLILRTDNLGEIKIHQPDIKSRTKIDALRKVGNTYWFPNPQSSRYFWGPNGYGLKTGEGCYQNIWVLYNQVSVGVTDNFSLGAGMLPLFLFRGPTPVWLVPKFSFPVVKDKFNIGTGAFLGTLVTSDGGGFFGLLYATTTFGSRDGNISFGLADGFAGGNWMKTPIINISVLARTGPRGYFITENYFISMDGQSLVLFSVGGRTIFRNVGLDYSFWLPISKDLGFFIVPMLGVTIPMGKSQVK
jgi:hypothetical protein